MKKIVLSLSICCFLFLGLDRNSDFYLVHAAEIVTNYQQFVLDWPITDPTVVNIFQPPDGSSYLLLIKNSNYWVKKLPSGSWNTGKILQEGTTKPGLILPTEIDTLTTYYKDNTQWQTATKGQTWYAHSNGGPWNYSGPLLTNENSSCGQPLPQGPIDTFTVFPYQGKNAEFITKNGVFYFKPDIDTSTFTWCGNLLKNETLPTGKLSGHTIFDFDGKQAELLVSGSTYWFLPDQSVRTIFKKGIINQIQANVSITMGELKGNIDQNIFGANLVWHEPFNIFNNEAQRNKLAGMIKDVGITMLRFPGGCGGDAYNWQNPGGAPVNRPGMTFTNYLDLIKKSAATPYYTLNLEGEGAGHANLNCHGLNDYPGTIAGNLSALTAATQQGVSINDVELGNEPWAGLAPFRNWRETWTNSEYAGVETQAVAALRSQFSGIKITSPWKETNIDVDYIQVHPYVFGDPTKDNPLTQTETNRTTLISARSFNKKLAVTEYNLYCWDGVIKDNGSNQYPINDMAGKMGNSLYLAEMLKMFAEEKVSYAMIWNLFDSKTSTWKCGLIKEDGGGVLQLTAVGKAFKLVKDHMYGTIIGSSVNGNQLQVIVTRSNNQLGIVLINPTITPIVTTLSGITGLASNLSVTQLSGSSLTDENPSLSSSTGNLTDTITLPGYSITGIKADLVTQNIPGDLNGDTHVNIYDYNLLVSKFGNPYTIFDYNNLVDNFEK